MVKADQESRVGLAGEGRRWIVGGPTGLDPDIGPEGIGPAALPSSQNLTCIMAPMKAATRQTFRTEYRFRDRGLTVSRGSPLPLGAA